MEEEYFLKEEYFQESKHLLEEVEEDLYLVAGDREEELGCVVFR